MRIDRSIPLGLILVLLIAFTNHYGFTSAGGSGEMPPPVADIAIREDPDDLWTGVPVHFRNNVSYVNDPRYRFLWNFGDGSDQTDEVEPVHVFEEPDTYVVSLYVIDEDNVHDHDTLVLSVRYNYGDTDIIVKALDPRSESTFKDPAPDQMSAVAVKRGGWVAYLCEQRRGDSFEVKVTIIGDRPADVFLLREEEFLAYRGGTGMDPVRFETKGTRSNVTGEFAYEYTARKGDRFYIVIDNRDWPQGTPTEGPIDYCIMVSPVRETGPPPDDPWDEVCIAVSTVGFILIFAWGYYLKRME